MEVMECFYCQTYQQFAVCVQIVDEAPPLRGIAAIQATAVNGLLVWPHLCVCTLRYPTLKGRGANVALLDYAMNKKLTHFNVIKTDIIFSFLCHSSVQ